MQEESKHLPQAPDLDLKAVDPAEMHRDRVPLSCTKAFDSVYYCYSPFHQGRQYYVNGQLDDCRSRVRRFRMCVMSRFRGQDESERMYEAEEMAEKAKVKGKPMWELRPEFVAHVQEHDRLEREKRKESNGRADGELENWWT